MEFLSVKANQIVDARGKSMRLRGTCVGGWMNMEDFINGFSGAEHTLRFEMAEVLGKSKAEFFFERFHDHFFNEADIAYLKSLGTTVVRLPLNYRHFEDDNNPFVYKEAGFQRLTHFNRHKGYGASNPVVSPDDRLIAFQLSVSEGAEGEGAGIFVLDIRRALTDKS